MAYSKKLVVEILNDIIESEPLDYEPITKAEIKPIIESINANISDIEDEYEYGESEDHVEGLLLDLWFDTIDQLRKK